MAAKKGTKFFIAECPLKDECSSQAWSRCKKCVSWESEKECRANLFHHFRNSALHWAGDVEGHKGLVDLVDVEQEEHEWTDEEPEEAQLPKRRKTEGKKHPIGMPVPKPHPIGAPLASTASSSASGSVATFQPLQQIVVQSVANDNITIPKALLQKMVDHMERSAAAVAHAVNLSQAARNAFEMEKKNIEDCTRDVRTLLSRIL